MLRKGLIEGYGSDFPNIDYKSPDFAMLNSLENNVYSFSVAKNYQELQQATQLLKDGERIRSFPEFKSAVQTLHRKVYVDWLQTEYGTAINGATLAARWVDFQKNKEAMPNLIYQTVGDARVRDSHRALDGVKRPIEDDFWKTYYPPNGWNCRCTVNQSGSGDPTPLKQVRYPQVLPMFMTNLAEAGLVFPKNHPYYDGIPAHILKRALYYLPQENAYRTLKTPNGNSFDWHALHPINSKELKIAEFLADNNNTVKVLPELDQHEVELRAKHMPSGISDNKNPDALVNGHIFDFKTISGSKKSAQHILDDIRQASNYAVEITGKTDDEQILRHVKGDLMHKVRMKQDFNLQEIWIINDNKLNKYIWHKLDNSFKAKED